MGHGKARFPVPEITLLRSCQVAAPSHNISSMGIFRLPWLWLGLLFLCQEDLRAASAETAHDPPGPSVAVFDPIDLHNQTADPEFGDFLRKAFNENSHWRVIPQDTVKARFKDYKMSSSTACHEFQCSFDAGNVLAADYVVFGSITPWGDLYAYTLNITHVRSSQVVWSKVGEVMRKQMGQPSAAMEATLAQIVGGLEPQDLDTRRGLRRGLLTVLDLSPGGSTPSRVMAERVATHLYASRNFDIMSRRELDELLAALDMRKSAFAPTDSGIFTLGGKMDITHLVYSRLTNKGSAGKGGEEFKLQLALYDISAAKKVREWPSQPTNDFRKILEFENKFFSSLFKMPDYDNDRDVESGWGPALSYGGVGLGLAMTTLFGIMAWSSWQEADQDYAEFQGARSRESAMASKQRVEENDRKALVFSGLGGLSLAGAGAMLILSF